MKIREITEGISLTTSRSDLINTIKSACSKAVSDAQAKLNNNLQQKTGQSPSQIKDDLDTYLMTTLSTEMISSLQTLLSQGERFMVDIQSLGQGVEASAGYNIIHLGYDLIKSLRLSILEDAMNENSQFSENTLKLIHRLASAVLHEYVHINQNRKQKDRYDDGYEPEYRSYLMKDKNEFETMVSQQIGDNAHKIYLASPQEIPAFAHNLAMDLIDIVTNQKDITDIDPKQYPEIISKLDSILKDGHTESKIFKMYKQFDEPNNKKYYQIFKRFMKLVYQEINNYKQHISKMS